MQTPDAVLDQLESQSSRRALMAFLRHRSELWDPAIVEGLYERVVRELSNEAGTASAFEVATRIGISRATARRYLEYLEERGQVALEPRYGGAGRPEHRYRLR